MKKHKIIIKYQIEYTVPIQAETLSEAKEKAKKIKGHDLKNNYVPDIKREELSKTQHRTSQQNKALHLWFNWYAEALKEKGITVKEFSKEGFDFFPNSYYIKENIFKEIMKKHGVKTTRGLDRNEKFSQIKESFSDLMQRVADVSFAFPSKEIQNYEQKENK